MPTKFLGLKPPTAKTVVSAGPKRLFGGLTKAAPAAPMKPLAALRAPGASVPRPASGGHRLLSGVEGFAVGSQKQKEWEHNKEKREHQPFRIWIKKGEQAEIIILDKDPIFLHEHHWNSAGLSGKGAKPDMDEVCLRDTGAICPLCQKLNREGTFEMVVTVIDCRSYIKNAGKPDAQEVKNQKRLLVVKGSLIERFKRLYLENGESFRGLHLRLIRDGEKVAFDEIKLLQRVPAEKLLILGDKGKPVDYTKAFPYPTEDEMRQMYGVGTVVGAADVADATDLSSVDWGATS